MANKMNSTKVVTGVVRLSYANVWEPATWGDGSPKYSVSIIIPKSDKQTLDAINAAVDAAIKEGVAKFGGKIPSKAALKLPLRDGDTERDDEAYKKQLFCECQQHNCSPDCGPQRSADSRPLRGVFRLLRQSIRQLLRLQFQRQPRYCLRPWKHPEGS